VIAADQIARYERASPLLLAMEEPGAPIELRWERDAEEWGQTRSHLESRMMMARSWRYSFLEHWSLVAQYLNPRRSLWLSQGGVDQPVPNSMVRGLPVNQSIVDPTATYALQVCTAGLVNGLMSSSRPWFKLKPAVNNFKIDRAAQLWFEEVEDRLYRVMAESNFYDCGVQMFKDLVSFGTSPMLIYEDVENVINCYVPVVGEYYLFVGPSFRVEGLMRQYVLTTSQIVEEFGLENCPPQVSSMWEQKGSNLDREFIIAHAVEPNFSIQRPGEKKAYGQIKGNYTYRENFWIYGLASPKPLSARGFHELPLIAPRWQVNGNDPYGTDCPGMVSLGDVMQLQIETRRKAELLEKIVRPPLNAPAEMKNQPSSILPGHVNYSSNTSNGMKPVFEVDAQALPGITADLKDIQARIKTGFFNDLFLMMAESTKDMTAYEVAQRQQEKLQVLGPVIERFQNEGASPAIRRIVSIMARKRLLPPMPPSLRGIPIHIEYVSMLAMAQRSVRTAGAERMLLMAEKSLPMFPEAAGIINFEEMLRGYNDDLGNSLKIVNDEQAFNDWKAQRAQTAQAEKTQQAAEHTLPAMASAAKDLGSVDVGGGINAAQLMAGVAGSPGAPPANM
jgi:Bacteriophage head to tail connecting protein